MNDWTLNRRTVVKGILLASSASWAKSSKAFASSCGDHIVRVGSVGTGPDTLNPFASWGAAWPNMFTYDFLVGVDAQRHPDRKGFAKEWSVADDKVTWTFKIWPDMKWSDGRPATAKDAAFTYNYLRDSIGMPDELNAGWNNTSGLQNVESIKAVDAETLQIVTKVPSRWPVENTILMVPEHIWKDISYADARSTFRNDPPLVGTGPMIVTELQQGQFVRVAPNQHFRMGQPKTAGMIFRSFGTADPIAQGLKGGDLDYGNLTAAQWADLSKDPNIAVGQSRTEQRDYLAFNTLSEKGAGSTKALQDPAFRDAMGYAIDQKTLIERAYRGHADPGVGLVMPVASDYYSELNDIRRHFDLAEAGRRLDAAGYRDANGDGIREDKEGNNFQLELIVATASGTLEIPVATVQFIAGWLGQIGIPVSVTQLDAGALNSRTAAPANGGGGWDLLVTSNWPSPLAGGILNMGSSNAIGAQNRAYWKNARFDELRSKVDTEVDQKKIKEHVDEASHLIYTDAPYIVLAYPHVLEGRRKDCFGGWGTQDMVSQWGYFPFDRLRPV